MSKIRVTMLSRNWISLLLIVVITLVFVTLWDSPSTTQHHEIGTEQQTAVAEMTLGEASAVQYSDDGQLKYRFRTQSARQFEPGGNIAQAYTLMQSPYIEVFSTDQPTWHIKAENGRASHADSQILLSGDVVVWQVDDKGNRSELKTSELSLQPEAKYAATDKSVIITGAFGRTDAVGLKADLGQNVIKLLSKVRGTHAPL